MNIAYVALPAAFFKLSELDLISDALIAPVNVVTPATETLSKFGRIFSKEEIGKYSGKISKMLEKIQQSKGATTIHI